MATAPHDAVRPNTTEGALRFASGDHVFPSMVMAMGEQAKEALLQNTYLRGKLMHLQASLERTVLVRPGEAVDWRPALQEYIVFALLVYYDFYRSELERTIPGEHVRILKDYDEQTAMQMVGLLLATPAANTDSVRTQVQALDNWFRAAIIAHKLDPLATPTEAFTMHRVPDRSATLCAGIVGHFISLLRDPLSQFHSVSTDSVLRFLKPANQFNYVARSNDPNAPVQRHVAFLHVVKDLTSQVLAYAETQTPTGHGINTDALLTDMMATVFAVVIAGALWDSHEYITRTLALDPAILQQSKAHATPWHLFPAGGCHGGMGRKKKKGKAWH